MRKEVLEEKKEQLLRDLSTLDEQSKAKIDHGFDCQYAYEAMAIEGKNTYTLEEVKQLCAGETIEGKTSQETREILNHQTAFDYIKGLLKEQLSLTEETLKDIHAMILDDIMIGGLYRNVNIQIMGATHQPPDHLKVYDRMKKYFLAIEESEDDAIGQAAFAHLQLTKIHPFIDGNGRLARLIMNYFLMKHGHLPISIPKEGRQHYFDLMEEFKVNKNKEPFIEFMTELLIARYTAVSEQAKAL